VSEFLKRILRYDSWANTKTGQGTKCDKTRYAVPVLDYLTETDLSTAYRSDDVAQRIVDKVPDAALDKGFDLMPSDVPAYDYFWAEWKRLKLAEKFHEAWKWGRLYGGCALILDIEDGQDRDQPLNLNSVKSIRWAQVIESRYYDVVRCGADPTTDYYRKPELIRIQSNIVPGGTSPVENGLATGIEFHASRVIFFWGKEIPWEEFESNDFCHDSVLQKAWSKIHQYDAAYSAVGKLIPEMRQNVYKMPGWAELQAAGKANIIAQRISDMNQGRSVHKMLVLDAEETIESDTITFSGIDVILDKFARRVVQASGMPHTITLGEGSTGNTSGRTETEEWAATISETQKNYLTPKIERTIELVFSQTGAAPLPEFGFEISYQSIISKTDADKVAQYKTIAEADEIYSRMGILNPEDFRNRFSEDGFKLDIQLSEEIPEPDPVIPPLEPPPTE